MFELHCLDASGSVCVLNAFSTGKWFRIKYLLCSIWGKQVLNHNAASMVESKQMS